MRSLFWFLSVCNKATGKQSRSIKSGFTPPEGGGDVCPPPQERNCKVDCESTFGPWGTTDCDPVTGKHSRSVSISPGTISVQPKDGWDGQGALCPPPEEQDCPIPCLGDYSEWSICASPVSFFFYFSFFVLFFLFFFMTVKKIKNSFFFFLLLCFLLSLFSFFFIFFTILVLPFYLSLALIHHLQKVDLTFQPNNP